MTTIRANWWTIWTISTFLLFPRIPKCRTSMWTTSKVLFKNSAGNALEAPFEKGTSNFGCRYSLLYSHVFLMVVLKPWTMTTSGLKSWMLTRSHLDKVRSFFEHITLRAFLIDIDEQTFVLSSCNTSSSSRKNPKRMHSYHSIHGWMSIFCSNFIDLPWFLFWLVDPTCIFLKVLLMTTGTLGLLGRFAFSIFHLRVQLLPWRILNFVKWNFNWHWPRYPSQELLETNPFGT